MNLTVVYVLEQPNAEWDGEKGVITADVLRRYLPRQYRRFQYFICGPTPLMDAMEKILPGIGIPRKSTRNILTWSRRKIGMNHAVVTRVVAFIALMLAVGCLLFAFAVKV
jgi:NAD(P)H-flavin reductase